MKTVEMPKQKTRREWRRSQVPQSGENDHWGSSPPDVDRTHLVLHESSQLLTSLGGTLELTLHLGSNSRELRLAIQQSLAQLKRLAQLLRWFRAQQPGSLRSTQESPTGRGSGVSPSPNDQVRERESKEPFESNGGTVDSPPVDYLAQMKLLRKPVLLEYEEVEKLRHDATTDPLTGLKNRRRFEECLAGEISRSKRYGTAFALLLLDLRRFKLANDTYGHSAGDEILRSVARACLESTRASDISCRIGGDEFAIVLPQAERRSAEAFAERLVRKFESYAKPLAPETPLGIDYGIAVFPEDADEAIRLFQRADKELYESKQKSYWLVKDRRWHRDCEMLTASS
jgi:diguanylate cyclase (GGDEF)-like protein